jgi:hypothetical protein
MWHRRGLLPGAAAGSGPVPAEQGRYDSCVLAVAVLVDPGG